MIHTLLRLSLSSAFLVLVALLPAHAQDKVEFDPARDLDRFEEFSFSEHSSLYAVEEYEKLRGNALTKAELDALRARWKTDVARATEKIAAIRSDPREQFWYAQQKELARTTFFGGRNLVEARIGGRVLLLVEMPSRETSGWVEKVAVGYGPWLKKIEQLFEQRYAKPLALARRPELQADIVCVLANEESYRDYTRQTGLPATEIGPATWDPRLKIVVGYEDPFNAEISPVWQRYPILREYVRALESAHFTGTGERASSLWLNEGLASYLAWHEGETPDTLDQRAIQTDALSAVVWAAQQRDQRVTFLHSLSELIDLRGTKSVIELAETRAASSGMANPDWQHSLRLFYGESALWQHFLQDAHGARHRPAFEKYLRSALAGSAGPEAFFTNVVVPDVAAFEKEFYTWLFDVHERVFPDTRVDRGAIDAILTERRIAAEPGAKPIPGGPSSAVPALAPLVVPVPSKTFQPAELAIDAGDLATQHALALGLALRGDLDGARARLEELAAKNPASEEGGRIARELDRVQNLARLRDGYLEHLRQTNKKWVTQWKGRQMITGIGKLENGQLYFVDNKLGLGKIALTEVNAYEIARQAGQPAEQGGAAPSTRAYAYFLHGDAKWEKLLKDDAGSKELREDAKGYYPELLVNGRAAAAIELLSKVELPKDAKEARSIAEQLKAVLAAGTDVPVVRRKLEGLRQLALHSITKTFVEKDPKDLAHGAWTSLGGGRVSVVYDFEDQKEALDFTKDPGVLKEWRRKLSKIEKPEENSLWDVENGDFVGSGAACYRYFLGFSAPLTVRWDLRQDPGDAETPGATTTLVTICDDLAGSAITVTNFGDLSVNDKATQFLKTFSAKDQPDVAYGQVFHMEIRHDGTTVTTSVDGEKRFEAPAGPRQNGKIRLWFHCDARIAIEKLEIEGKIDAASMDALKAETFALRLKELGFP